MPQESTMPQESAILVQKCFRKICACQNQENIQCGVIGNYTSYKKKRPKWKQSMQQPRHEQSIPHEQTSPQIPPKEQFRVICEENIPYIRNIDLPIITKNNPLEAVLIEYRIFPHMEFLIRNAMIKLGDKWSHTVVCGNLNYDFMVSMCANISPEITVIKTDYDNLNLYTYNSLLASKSFWEMFAGEKILLYQEDSCIFKSNIDDFLQWDYIGAPWLKTQNDTPNCVGNGGFSLRTRQCMIDVIDRISIYDTNITSSTSDYMRNSGMTVCPEDVYFSKNMQDYGIGKVADWDSAFAFSSESVYNGDSFGGHNFWLSDERWNMRVKLLHYIKPYANPGDISMFMLNAEIPYSHTSFIFADDILQNIPRGKHNSKEKISIDLLHSCILIVDFANGGGGTSVFIESIICRYKKYQTFLIARNFNGRIYFTINDEYELEQSYNDDEAFMLLSYNKDKIEKFFVNHVQCHSTGFINNLFTMDKQITTITHDLNLLFNTPQISFDDIEKYICDQYSRSAIDINKYHQIITQNIANLYLYNNYIHDKNKIIITPLPDFKNTKDIVHTSNNNIVIGIIGGIHDLKGRKELEQIINYYKNTNVKIVLFGSAYIENFANNYPYKDINELNHLFTVHSPNILIELSIWNETYSYTLTIAMLTQLPILYLKKNGLSVVENRLSKYNKAYAFTTIGELIMLVERNHQNFFCTIEPVVYFNEWWDNYFITNDFNTIPEITDKYIDKNIVLITSKLIVSTNSYSYVNTRSIYTKEQRFLQTINTITSIRKYIPESYIVLIDNSMLNKIEYHVIKQITDYFINITDDNTLNYYTNEHRIRLFAELSQQLCFYDNFLKKIDTTKIKHFFKISGRYYINNSFNFDNYNNDFNIFKKNTQVRNRDYYYTSFYKLNSNILLEYFEQLNIILSEKDSYNENTVSDFEVVVPSKIANKTIMNHLGITQIYSVWNKIENI